MCSINTKKQKDFLIIVVYQLDNYWEKIRLFFLFFFNFILSKTSNEREKNSMNLQLVFYLEFANRLVNVYNEVYLQDFHIHKSQMLKNNKWILKNNIREKCLPWSFPLAPWIRFQLTTLPQFWNEEQNTLSDKTFVVLSKLTWSIRLIIVSGARSDILPTKTVVIDWTRFFYKFEINRSVFEIFKSNLVCFWRFSSTINRWWGCWNLENRHFRLCFRTKFTYIWWHHHWRARREKWHWRYNGHMWRKRHDFARWI